MNLERQVYHSGAIVGNDVNKLTETANIKKLSNVFKPAKWFTKGIFIPRESS